jgi:hypothetical protein
LNLVGWKIYGFRGFPPKSLQAQKAARIQNTQEVFHASLNRVAVRT